MGREPRRARLRGDGAPGADPFGVPARRVPAAVRSARSEEHTSELQSLAYLVCRLLLEKKKNKEKESGLDLPIANLEHFAPDETAHHAPARARRAVALLPLARLTVTSQGAVGEHPVQLL